MFRVLGRIETCVYILIDLSKDVMAFIPMREVPTALYIDFLGTASWRLNHILLPLYSLSPFSKRRLYNPRDRFLGGVFLLRRRRRYAWVS